jgi:predicted nuclease of predicted toxin-antitoxin system
VHLTLGILRTSQAVFYALSFFWLDGFAVPAPSQVTQTVKRAKSQGCCALVYDWLCGRTCFEIKSWARAHGAIVFTHDLDFGAMLAATKANAPSVIHVCKQ